MIRFEQVSKRYAGGITALTGLTLAIESGEMVILAGHSGAGKSTLLKLIPAIERPTQGLVVVNGQNVSALKRAAVPFLRRNLGQTCERRVASGVIPKMKDCNTKHRACGKNRKNPLIFDRLS